MTVRTLEGALHVAGPAEQPEQQEDEQDRRPEAEQQRRYHGAPVSSGSALTVTSFSCSRRESSSVLANAGISVRKRVVGFSSSNVTFFLNVPWMSVPLDVISSTLLEVTRCGKNGLYGTTHATGLHRPRADEQVEPGAPRGR